MLQIIVNKIPTLKLNNTIALHSTRSGVYPSWNQSYGFSEAKIPKGGYQRANTCLSVGQGKHQVFWG